MPAKSKAQQRLFGMVHAYQKGRKGSRHLSDKIKELAKRVDPEDVEHFARTKASTLPERKKDDEKQRKSASSEEAKKPSQSEVVRARVGALIRRIQHESNAAKEVTKARMAPKHSVKKAEFMNGVISFGQAIPGKHYGQRVGVDWYDMSALAGKIQANDDYRRFEVKDAAAELLLKSASNPIGGEGRLMMQRAVTGRPVDGSKQQKFQGLTRPYPGQMRAYNARVKQLGLEQPAPAAKKTTPKQWAKDTIEYALGVVARQNGGLTTPPIG